MRTREVREIDLSDLRGRAFFAFAFSLMVAVNYLDVPIHEIAHGLAVVGLGGRFYGFDLGPFGGHGYYGGVGRRADRAVVAIAGGLGQYIVGSLCLVLLRRTGERRFVLRSIVLWMALGNLADPSLSLQTVSRDARRFTYYVVLTTGRVEAFTLVRLSGLVVCLLAIYIVSSNVRSFLLEWFPGTKPRRTRVISYLMCLSFVVALGSFRLLSTWGVQVSYALLFDLLAASNTALLVLLPRSPGPTRHRGLRARDVIPAVVFLILPHLLLLFPSPLYVAVPMG